jgi:hypothetical protein
MRALFGFVGAISILLGIAAVVTVRSDIQITLVATLILGGFSVIGIAAVLGRLDRLLSQQPQHDR